MSGLLDFLNPITSLAGVANGIIGKFVADPKEKADAQLALVNAQTAAAQAVLDAQVTLAQSHAAVITSETSSHNWLEADWRALVMLFLAVVVGFAIFNGGFDWKQRPIDPKWIQASWDLLKIGVGGYFMEPIVTNGITAFKGGNGK